MLNVWPCYRYNIIQLQIWKYSVDSCSGIQYTVKAKNKIVSKHLQPNYNKCTQLNYSLYHKQLKKQWTSSFINKITVIGICENKVAKVETEKNNLY